MIPGEGQAAPVLQASFMTDRGRIRECNEDNAYSDLQQGLFIVSDGLGGKPSGGTASQIVVTVLPLMLQQKAARLRGQPIKAVEEALQQTISDLSNRLWTESAGRKGLQGMGATVVVAWTWRNIACIAHLGDSRLYLFRNKALQLKTEDHSVVAMLLRNNEIAREQARDHPARGRLSRYVGMEESVPPDTQCIELLAGDRLLLCSDGLHNMLDDSRIAAMLQLHPEPEVACTTLVAAANEAGGRDNITALVVNYSES